MKIKLSEEECINLYREIFKALKTLPEKDSEPRLVAKLVECLPEAIYNCAIPGYDVKSCGVFIHQSPKVTCRDFNGSSVELGDLLLVRTEKRNDKVVNRRAMLLQAKKIKGIPCDPDNKEQHHLYANWPTFKYTTPKDLKGKKRHITGLDIYEAAQYLLIAQGNACEITGRKTCHPFCVCGRCPLSIYLAFPTPGKLSHYRCFVSEFVELILGDAGKEFKSPPPKRIRKWDRVIDDLLHVARLRSKVMKGNRGRGAFFVSGNKEYAESLGLDVPQNNDNDNGSSGPPGDGSGDNNHGGISIFYIEVKNQTDNGIGG